MKKLIPLLILSYLMGADDNAPSQRTRDREVDIHHIKIDVSVNIEAGMVKGNVTHTFSPFSSSLDAFSLDAEDMTILRARLAGKDIGFNQANDKVYLTLNKSMSWEDTAKVRLDYTANPRKGTYFIKPDETYPEKPLQAWTQGED
ncbi:MAG: hypothetical protein HN716_07775, partial [Candidatus Marinimicrobia bacterium]|nr:hypothetical protein [Candidatus Neomarinimicrobiota bacterium]